MVSWVTTQTHSDICWPIGNGRPESLQRERPCLACGKQQSILKQTLNTLKFFQKLSEEKIERELPYKYSLGGGNFAGKLAWTITNIKFKGFKCFDLIKISPKYILYYEPMIKR